MAAAGSAGRLVRGAALVSVGSAVSLVLAAEVEAPVLELALALAAADVEEPLTVGASGLDEQAAATDIDTARTARPRLRRMIRRPYRRRATDSRARRLRPEAPPVVAPLPDQRSAGTHLDRADI